MGSDQWRRNERLLQSGRRLGLRRRGATGSSPLAQGQVEKNVQDSRHQILQEMPDFPDLAMMTAWLEQRCLEVWQETPHGTLPGTIADVWAEERAALMPLPPACDGFIELSKRVSPTCLISFERNRDTRSGVIREPACQPADLSGPAGRGGRGQHPVRTLPHHPAQPQAATADDP